MPNLRRSGVPGRCVRENEEGLSPYGPLGPTASTCCAMSVVPGKGSWGRRFGQGRPERVREGIAIFALRFMTGLSDEDTYCALEIAGPEDGGRTK
jgi:hypothetical protein